MKTLCTLALVMLSLLTTSAVRAVDKVDLTKFSGKWYSLYSIPTMFDKDSRETTTYYTLSKEGYYNVVTEAKKGDENGLKIYKSKLYPVAGTNNTELKAQFMWPFKVDYSIIELADDYSYVVVGHPEKKFLFIMSRKPYMDPKLHEEIVARCKAKGYDVAKLVSQKHHA